MSRTFNSGRQSEVLFNDELYAIYKIIEHINDVPVNPTVGPNCDIPGSLWLDRQSSENGILKYYDAGNWRTVFGNLFKIIGDIASPVKPSNPVKYQLWLTDGMLMYYDGSEWTNVKAVSVGETYNSIRFDNFLMLNQKFNSANNVIDSIPDDFDFSKLVNWQTGKTYSVGDIILYLGNLYKALTAHTSSSTFSNDYTDGGTSNKWTKLTSKTQYLIPKVQYDKIFVGGNYTSNFETINDSCIQFPTIAVQNNLCNIVHVNPVKIRDIKKEIIALDKANPDNNIIDIPENTSEYYGFKNGFGTLLVKDTDYTTYNSGIKLSSSVVANYDFIEVINYKFGDVRIDGSLTRGTVPLTKGSALYIGQVTDPMCVFVGGLYLDEDEENYVYNMNTGYLSLTIEQNQDMSIISFPNKVKGEISSLSSDGAQGIMTVNSTYSDLTKLIVLVSGESMNVAINDYSATSNKDSTTTISVPNAKIGMKYAVCDGAEMIITRSQVSETDSSGNPVIKYAASSFGDGENPIVFVDGLLIAEQDLNIDVDPTDSTKEIISIYGLRTGQDYILLSDKGFRMVFNDYVSFLTIPTKPCDSLFVYAKNKLLCDKSILYTTKLSTSADIGEVKGIISGDSVAWSQFGRDKNWTTITDQNLIDSLMASSCGYMKNNRSFSMLADYSSTTGNNTCSYIGYNFGNTVENPLRYGYITLDGVTNTFKLNYTKAYRFGTNSLAVYLNGVRQYNAQEIDSQNFKLDYTSDPAANSAVGLSLLYVVETPLEDQIKSCEREILTDDRLTGDINVYKTQYLNLIPGNVRVFINGLRQPREAFSVLDNQLIQFNTSQPLNGSTILVEVRYDYRLSEITLDVNEDSRSITIGDDGIFNEIINSDDVVMAYINGRAYAKGFKKSNDKANTIEFKDQSIINFLKSNAKNRITLEWR